MNKKIIAIVALIGLSLTNAGNVSAQLQLPQPSPSATVTQTVGLTEISIEYSSPGVKGRKIFGELVPFGKIWRSGANSATKISFSKDVIIEGIKVPKGKYALLTIPQPDLCTILITKDLNATAEEYKKDEEVLRFDVKTSAVEFRERLTYIFSNFSDSQVTVDIEWERTRIAFNIKLDTEAQAKENIDKELGKTWRTYNSAARYYLDNKKDLELGMKYADQSISLKEEWFNLWTKAQLSNLMGNNADAYKYAVKSKELGDKNVDGFFYKANVEKAIVDWKATGAPKGKK